MIFDAKVAGRSDVGSVRTNNEDSFVVADPRERARIDTSSGTRDLVVSGRGLLLAVSDGMGGAEAGEVASAIVVESLHRTFAKAPLEGDEDSIAAFIDTAVSEANREVIESAKQPGRQGMGATLTAVLLHAGNAYIAEVGDSRAYVVRGRRIRQMTKDQSFVQLLIDAGALSPDDAKVSPHKNVILQAMGQKASVTPAVGRLALRRGDKLLLCSDGLTNKVEDTEIADIVDAAATLDEACARLIALANERGGEDNITAVLAEVEGAALAMFDGQESVTHTYQLVHDYVEVTSSPSSSPRSPSVPAPAPSSGHDEVNDEGDLLPGVSAGPPGDLKTRPQQMAVAALIIGAMLYVLYTALRDR